MIASIFNYFSQGEVSADEPLPQSEKKAEPTGLVHLVSENENVARTYRRILLNEKLSPELFSASARYQQKVQNGELPKPDILVVDTSQRLAMNLIDKVRTQYGEEVPAVVVSGRREDREQITQRGLGYVKLISNQAQEAMITNALDGYLIGLNRALVVGDHPEVVEALKSLGINVDNFLRPIDAISAVKESSDYRRIFLDPIKENAINGDRIPILGHATTKGLAAHMIGDENRLLPYTNSPSILTTGVIFENPTPEQFAEIKQIFQKE